MTIESFEVTGLHGHLRVETNFKSRSTIIVGPNGTGKSTLLNILYYTITSQWDRLKELQFESVEIRGRDGADKNNPPVSLRLTRAEIQELSLGRRADRESLYVRRLSAAGLLEQFLSTPSLSATERKRYSTVLALPERDIAPFHSYFKSKHADSFVLGLADEIEITLRKLCPEFIVYLPTYRRIEQDLRQLSPTLLEDVKRYGRNSVEFGRQTERFAELVQFGMDDVKNRISEHLLSIRAFAGAALGRLTSDYLRDIIRQNTSQSDLGYLRSLGERQIQEVLSRADETSLSPKDKATILAQIVGISRTRAGRLTIYQKNVIDYFIRLARAHEQISEREKSIRLFTDTINEYFLPRKRFEFDSKDYSFRFLTKRGDEIPLGALSSGEKQLVSILSYIYLQQNRDFLVIIDEPELSLSVTWQRSFLRDILDSPNVHGLFAVTHSPFIYSSGLEGSAVDIESFFDEE